MFPSIIKKCESNQGCSESIIKKYESKQGSS